MNLRPLARRARQALETSGAALTSLLYPPHCAACLQQTEAGIHLCSRCAQSVSLIEAPFCERCSQPFDGAIKAPFTCRNCRDRQFHFQAAVSAVRSQTIVREFVHRFKYEGHFFLRHQLADWLELTFADERLRGLPGDFLVPVPLHGARQREREFNQAAVLAHLLGQRLGTPIWSGLERVRYTSTQTRLDRRARMENLRGAFRVRHNRDVLRRHLILIDDVFTTGSTAEECARVLREAGAASVRVATVARG